MNVKTKVSIGFFALLAVTFGVFSVVSFQSVDAQMETRERSPVTSQEDRGDVEGRDMLVNQEEITERQREIRAQHMERRSRLQAQTRERIENTREEVVSRTISLEELRERRAEVIAERLAGAKEGVTTAVNNMFRSNRNNADRLSNIADAIESRIAAMDQDGHDVSHVRGHLLAAQTLISSSQDSLSERVLQEITSEIRGAQSSAELREVFRRARELMTEVRADLREAREELREALADIRGLLQ